MKKIKEYFAGVKKEFARIKWPTISDLVKYSIAVIIFILIFMVFFLGIDAVNAYIRQIYEGAK